MSENLNWVVVGSVGNIREDGVIPFDFGADSFAIYHTKSGYYATEGFCTHEMVHLCDGYVMDDTIECNMHQGRFDIRTGQALCAPVTVALKTFPVKLDGDTILIGLPAD